MNQNEIVSSNNKYNENKISSYFYNKTVHEKSKEKIDNLHKYKPSKKVSVLLGDYYEQMSIISNSILESIGCKTTIVPSCEALIQEFMDNPDKYNVIITNNTYSNNGSGEEVLKAVKKIKKDIKVIVLTVERNETKYFINVIGFDGYLEKPLDQRKAISVLTALIPKLKFNRVEPMYYIYNNKNKF
jgi:DNA-binding NtrC family response regulator